MKIYTSIEVECGDNIRDVAVKAKELAITRKEDVAFTFNDFECLVNADTDINELEQKYLKSINDSKWWYQ